MYISVALCLVFAMANAGQCSGEASLRCYAARYPDLLNAFCSGAINQCSIESLATHWTAHGEGEGRVCECIVSSPSVYMGIAETVNFDTARSRCAAFGGQLATFGSAAEFAALLAVRNALGVDAFIGLTDRDAEHLWRFVDGDTSFCQAQGNGLDCDDIPQWAAGQPDNWVGQGGQDCAQLWSSSIDDVSCNAVLPYICEFNANGIAFGDVVSGPASYFGDRPGEAPASYFVFEVTGLQGSGTLLLIFAMSLCIVCLSCLLCKNYKNYQSAHAKGYGKVVMDTESEL